jgi:hypothetical protein
VEQNSTKGKIMTEYCIFSYGHFQMYIVIDVVGNFCVAFIKFYTQIFVEMLIRLPLVEVLEPFTPDFGL